MVKRRSFTDIDITKDFQKRLEIKNYEVEKENLELKKVPLENMSLQELELYNENKMKNMDLEKEEDTFSKILIEDVK
jgi:hypothetical protein